jgi:hypothetical protein
VYEGASAKVYYAVRIGSLNEHYYDKDKGSHFILMLFDFFV